MLEMMDMHPPCFLTKTRCTYKLCGKIYLHVSRLRSWRMQRKWVIPIATVTHRTWVILLRNLRIDRQLKVANIYWTKTRSRFRNKNIIQLAVLVNFVTWHSLESSEKTQLRNCLDHTCGQVCGGLCWPWSEEGLSTGWVALFLVGSSWAQ